MLSLTGQNNKIESYGQEVGHGKPDEMDQGNLTMDYFRGRIKVSSLRDDKFVLLYKNVP